MIVKVAEVLGGDERAIRIARKLTFVMTWMSDWDWQQFLYSTKRKIGTLHGLMRRAA